jgi:hypothetical protein
MQQTRDDLGKFESKYKPKYIRLAKQYLEDCQDTFGQYVLEKDKKTGKKVTKYVSTGLKVRLPTVDGLSNLIGVEIKAVVRWTQKYPKFKKVVDAIRAEQKRRLIDMSLSGDYNPTIAKLILSANYGMREGIDTTTNGESINTFNDQQIDRIAERIASRKRSNGSSSSEE